MVLEDFMINAEKKAKDIMVKRGLSTVPFTNTQLRAMLINWFITEDDMLRISGIRPDMVTLYSKPFLKLANESHIAYKEMNGRNKTAESQHARNVIDLVSDEEESDYGDLSSDFEAEEDAADAEGEESAYFRQEAKRAELNAKFGFTQTDDTNKKVPVAKPTTAKKAATRKSKNYRAMGSRAASGSGRNSGGGGEVGRDKLRALADVRLLA
jgi:bloom syndrome protein